MNTLEQPWITPLGVPPLADREVHVWRAALDLPAHAIAPLQATFSPDEHARAERFRFDRDRRRFVAGRGLLRTILARYTALAPEQIRFMYGAHGKPALDPNQNALQFNVAHSHELALIAVGKRALGVDVEHVRPLVDAAALARRICSPAEQAALPALPQADQATTLLRWWTAKEAFVKAHGTGLSAPLDQIEVGPEPFGDARRVIVAGQTPETTAWWLHTLQPATGYVGALVVGSATATINYWQWPYPL